MDEMWNDAASESFVGCQKKKKTNSRSKLGTSALWPFPEVGDQKWFSREKEENEQIFEGERQFHSYSPLFISSSFFSSNNENKRQEKTSNDTRTAQENGTK